MQPAPETAGRSKLGCRIVGGQQTASVLVQHIQKITCTQPGIGGHINFRLLTITILTLGSPNEPTGFDSTSILHEKVRVGNKTKFSNCYVPTRANVLAMPSTKYFQIDHLSTNREHGVPATQGSPDSFPHLSALMLGVFIHHLICPQ